MLLHLILLRSYQLPSFLTRSSPPEVQQKAVWPGVLLECSFGVCFTVFFKAFGKPCEKTTGSSSQIICRKNSSGNCGLRGTGKRFPL